MLEYVNGLELFNVTVLTRPLDSEWVIPGYNFQLHRNVFSNPQFVFSKIRDCLFAYYADSGYSHISNIKVILVVDSLKETTRYGIMVDSLATFEQRQNTRA